MSAKYWMKIQIAMNQKKKTSIAHNHSPRSNGFPSRQYANGRHRTMEPITGANPCSSYSEAMSCPCAVNAQMMNTSIEQ